MSRTPAGRPAPAPRTARGTVRSTRNALDDLERRRLEFGAGAAAGKLALLVTLARRTLPSAADVLRLHEALCFMRAYPDDAQVLANVERLLGAFDRRADLRRHRGRLVNSGIAGTEIRFRFFAPMASWLAQHWPRHLAIDWKEFEAPDLLERLLPLMVHFAETPALDEVAFTPREWIERLKGPDETDAGFLVRRFERLPMNAFARELIQDQIDVPMVLSPGPDTPSRTRSKHEPAPITYVRAPIARSRPRLTDSLRVAPRSMRRLDPRQGRRLIDLARAAMVTRERDLDVFSWASEHDVRWIDCGDGLAFAGMGATPERRLLLESVYGYLTLVNGVPVGYVLSGALFGSAEIAYNVFETFRGVEAARIFGRVLAMIRALFGADSFMIPPYQLGEGNAEAQQSGAWWFYQKLGFRPRDAVTLGLMRSELARMQRRPSHRSSLATLRRLSGTALYFHLGAPRADVLGRIELPNVGLRVLRALAERCGADRERGARECEREAGALLGVRDTGRWSAGERLAWARWAPLVAILPGVRRWSVPDRRALVAVIRAKGGERESDFVRRFDAHPPLRRAIVSLAEMAT